MEIHSFETFYAMENLHDMKLFENVKKLQIVVILI